MYRYRHNDVPKWYFVCTEVVQQKAHVPKWISYVPKSSCTESVHPFVPKLSCTESDVTLPVAYWLRIRADSFYLFNDLSARIVRTSVCHRRSCSTSTRICSLPREQWLRIRVDVLTIRLPVFVALAHGLKIRADVPRPYI